MKKYFLTLILITAFFPADIYTRNCYGDSTAASEPETESKWGLGAFPIIGYESGYGFTLGGGGVIYFEPEDKNQDCDEIVFVTSRNQAEQYDLMTEYSKYFKDNIWSINGKFCYQSYPDDYQGEDYDAVFLPFEIGVSYKIFRNFYIGPLYSFQYSDTSFENDYSSDENTPGAGRMHSSGLGGNIIYRTVPKGQLYRREGYIFTLSNIYFSPLLMSDKKFNAITADYRHYFPVFGQCVFAFQIKGQSCLGDTPFFEVPVVKGKDILRGGSDGSGKFFLAGQTEFRFPVFWRIGAAVFIGAGEAEDKINDFGTDTCIAGGAGMRITLNQKKTINLRFDLAYNDQGEKNIYIKIKEAF